MFFLELFVGVVRLLFDSLFRATKFLALTSPSHHQSGLEVVVSTFSKTEQWVVVSSSNLPATFSSMHTALQSLTKVAQFSLRVVASPYVDRHSFLARGRVELLKWSGERTGPTLTSLCPSLEVCRPSLYFSAHWCPPCRAN